MRRIPFLVKRGNDWWWRRRLPAFAPLKENEINELNSEPLSLPPKAGHLSISLRTACATEARRRATSLNLRFEDGCSRIETYWGKERPQSLRAYAH